MLKRIDAKQKIIMGLIIVWMIYSGLRIIKHGVILLTQSWETPVRIPTYLQESKQYQNYWNVGKP